MKVLSLQDVEYHYANSEKIVLKKVNADFEKGKLYAIMGRSGAGKSTMLSVLAGLDVASSGKVLYKDTDIRNIDRDKYRAKDIGVIFQAYNLLQNASAAQNITLSMSISDMKIKNKKEKAYEILKQVGIDKESANRKILKLSGGEQQRVGIARAISHNPDIVIADEPTGNLDYETEQKVMQILIDLAHNSEKCVIIVTHSKEVAAYADIVYNLQNGKLT
ncbi:MAG: ABC transporter ATP-binding protein [Bacilli bacterium]|nr:ABC transporter ATP-binding protein [Bacilli bacterium]